MNILVIKLTSLGDVLHSTGHIRTLRESFPDSAITVLTARSSLQIFKHNPNVDDVLVFEKDQVKRHLFRRPWHALRLVYQVIRQVRQRHFDLALDLQGRFKSVIFLYAARARRKYVKGRWPLLPGFVQPQIHAISEMDGVLEKAGLTVRDSSMEIHTSEQERTVIDELLERLNPQGRRLLLISPFTRWPTKNWDIANYAAVITQLDHDLLVAITGVEEQRATIDRLAQDSKHPRIVNLAGQLNLLEFAELIKRAILLITGDSFAMHLAAALNVPVIAIFGPTDERRVGPRGPSSILRADACLRCYRRTFCKNNCINLVSTQQVLQETQRWIAQAAFDFSR